MNSHVAWSLVLALAVAGCSGDDDDDAGQPDAAAPDAASADAATELPDAAAGITFTGEYLDLDSTKLALDGVEFATVTEIGNETNTAMTAPNGRVIMTIAEDGDFDALFEQSDYLSLRYGVAAGFGDRIFTARGMTPARAANFYSVEFEETRNAADTTVIVTLPEGATAELGAANAGGQTSVGFTVFANVVGTSTTVTVTPPAGQTCITRSPIALNPDGIAFTEAFCE